MDCFQQTEDFFSKNFTLLILKERKNFPNHLFFSNLCNGFDLNFKEEHLEKNAKYKSFPKSPQNYNKIEGIRIKFANGFTVSICLKRSQMITKPQAFNTRQKLLLRLFFAAVRSCKK